MAIHRVVDSNVFIYSLLKNHPAYKECSSYLAKFDEPDVIFTTTDSLVEIFQVLLTFYRIETKIILENIQNLLNSNISFYHFTSETLLNIFEETAGSKLEINDVKLYFLALKVQAPIVVTDDGKFAKFVKKNNLLHETPISDDTRKQMDNWEKKNLPPKGLPRTLLRIHNYLEEINAEIAQQFRVDTGGFKKIPEL